MPTGSYRRKKIDPKKIKKIKEGGKKADEIREKANEHHKKEEIPKAEEIDTTITDAYKSADNSLF